MENKGTGIDRIVMVFYGKTYKSGNFVFMREQESKDETESLMKLSNDVIFTQISAKAGKKNFGEKVVATMVEDYRQIEKGPMEGKPVSKPNDSGTLSYREMRKVL